MRQTLVVGDNLFLPLRGAAPFDTGVAITSAVAAVRATALKAVNVIAPTAADGLQG